MSKLNSLEQKLIDKILFKLKVYLRYPRISHRQQITAIVNSQPQSYVDLISQIANLRSSGFLAKIQQKALEPLKSLRPPFTAEQQQQLGVLFKATNRFGKNLMGLVLLFNELVENPKTNKLSCKNNFHYNMEQLNHARMLFTHLSNADKVQVLLPYITPSVIGHVYGSKLADGTYTDNWDWMMEQFSTLPQQDKEKFLLSTDAQGNNILSAKSRHFSAAFFFSLCKQARDCLSEGQFTKLWQQTNEGNTAFDKLLLKDSTWQLPETFLTHLVSLLPDNLQPRAIEQIKLYNNTMRRARTRASARHTRPSSHNRSSCTSLFFQATRQSPENESVDKSDLITMIGQQIQKNQQASSTISDYRGLDSEQLSQLRELLNQDDFENLLGTCERLKRQYPDDSLLTEIREFAHNENSYQFYTSFD